MSVFVSIIWNVKRREEDLMHLYRFSRFEIFSRKLLILNFLTKITNTELFAMDLIAGVIILSVIVICLSEINYNHGEQVFHPSDLYILEFTFSYLLYYHMNLFSISAFLCKKCAIYTNILFVHIFYGIVAKDKEQHKNFYVEPRLISKTQI